MQTRKKWIRLLAFLLLCSVLFIRLFQVFRLKAVDGTYQLQMFYEEEPQTIDVICFGSSHMYENINTQTLWDEFGIADFNLGGSIQPMWNTYFYMKEALKTQRPRVMVLDVYTAIREEAYSPYPRAMKNTFGMKPSRDKIEAIRVSYLHRNVWDVVDYLLEFPALHDRYSEISEGDFKNLPRDYDANEKGVFPDEDWKGFYLNMACVPQELPEMKEPEEPPAIKKKAEYYFRKIIALCKEENVPLLLLVSPYPVSLGALEKYAMLEEIAKEEDVPFLNCNEYYDEIGLDFSADYADDEHLNDTGSAKYSAFLGQYLKDHYDIPDRRGDERYASWDRMAAWYRNEIEARKAAEAAALAGEGQAP